MKVSGDDIRRAFNELGFSIEDGKNGGFVSRVQGNNGETVTSFISIEEDSELVQFTCVLPVKVDTAKRSQAFDLINLVHGKAIWGFRYWMDTDDGSIVTFGSYSALGDQFSVRDFNHIFMCCVFAADRIYPCLMALNFGDKQAKEAFDTFYFKKKSA